MILCSFRGGMRFRRDPAAPRHHFVEDTAERVNVRTGIGRFAFPLLRRHVGRRAEDHAASRHRFILARLCQAEILEP